MLDIFCRKVRCDPCLAMIRAVSSFNIITFINTTKYNKNMNQVNSFKVIILPFLCNTTPSNYRFIW